MTTAQQSLESAADALLAVLHDSNRAPGDYPTPVAGMTLGDLREHVTRSARGFAAAVGVEATGDVRADARAVVEALADRPDGAPVVLPFGELPVDVARQAVAIEYLVHAWDIAQASSTVLAVSDDLAEDVLGHARATITEQHRASGAFGKATDAPGDAGAMEQLAAFTGRDLGWRAHDHA